MDDELCDTITFDALVDDDGPLWLVNRADDE